MEEGLKSHPIGLIVTDDLRRSRLTVFFRLLLALPHLVAIYFYSIIAEIVAVIGWIVTVFAGRLPDGMHNFLATYVRYTSHVYAYLLLLADPWPPFANDYYPIDVRIDPPRPQSRLTVFFRLLLAIPAILLTTVFRVVNSLVAFLGWFYCLAFGRMHQGMRDISAWMLRYEVQTYGYLFLLTGRYPSLSGAPTA